MELLLFIGIGLIILGSLSGIAIYIDTFVNKANVTTLWWLFALCIIGGSIFYNWADKSSMGIIYSSYVLMLLGAASAITIFLSETGLFEHDEKTTLWVFFLICLPLGAIGISYETILIY